MKTDRGVDIELHTFFTSALVEMCGQPHASAGSLPGKEPLYHWVGGGLYLRACLDVVAKRKIASPAGDRNPDLQPVVT
jgi:hypothetical protein